jgi:hypothetical protein
MRSGLITACLMSLSKLSCKRSKDLDQDLLANLTLLSQRGERIFFFLAIYGRLSELLGVSPFRVPELLPVRLRN